jgi:hypothetical protein
VHLILNKPPGLQFINVADDALLSANNKDRQGPPFILNADSRLGTNGANTWISTLGRRAVASAEVPVRF